MKTWRIWNGWGPLKSDGLYRCVRIGPDGSGGIEASDPLHTDIRGTEKDFQLVAASPALLEACEGVAIMLRTVLKDYKDEPWAKRVNAAILIAKEGELPAKAEEVEKGPWFGNQYCPHDGEPPIDGCYFCGRPVARGPHNHTQVRPNESSTGYSCVCDTC